MDREDLAREALTRKSGLANQITDLKAQHAQLQGEEEKLTLAQQRLQAKVESFRTRKETIKATYTAAEAQTRINEAMSGIGEEMGDVGMAIQRAEDKTAQMQARAGAIDELIASGALDDASAINGGDDIARELEAMSSAGRRRGRAGPAQGPASGARRRSRPRRRRRHPRGRGREAGVGTRRERGRRAMIVRILGEGQYDVADEAWTGSTSSTPPSRRPSRPVTRRRSRAALAALLDGVRTAGVRPRRRQPRRVRPDPAARRRHHRRGPRAAQRRRPDPGLGPVESHWAHGTLPLRQRRRADRPDDHGHVPARRAVRRARRRLHVRRRRRRLRRPRADHRGRPASASRSTSGGSSDKVAMRAMRAREVTPEEAPELHGMIDRLCALADMPKPRVGDRRHRTSPTRSRPAARRTAPSSA